MIVPSILSNCQKSIKHAVSGLVITASSATYAQVIDLNTIYNMALANDAAFASQLYEYQAQEQLLPEARAALFPTIDLTASQTSAESPVQAANQVTDNTSRSHRYGLVASQPLFDMGIWYGYKGAESTVARAQAAFVEAEQNLILTVAQTYFTILENTDQLRFAEAEKDALAQQLEQIQQQYDVGLVASTNVYQAQAGYDAQVAAVINAQNELSNSWEDLYTLIGPNNVTDLYTLDHTFNLEHPTPKSSQPWVDESLEKNPVITQARYQVAISDNQLGVEKSRRWPTLNVSGGYGQKRYGTVTGPEDSWEKDWNYTLNASVSLFSGFGTTARIQEAEYLQVSAENILEDTIRTVTRNVRNSYRDVVTSISQTQAYHQAVCSAQESLKATEAGYEVGTQTVVDVLGEISNLYEQESNFVTARYSYIIALLFLKANTGTLSYNDLDEINQWLRLPEESPDPTSRHDCSINN